MNATILVDCPFCDAPAHVLEVDGAAALVCADCGVDVALAVDPEARALGAAA